MPASGKPVTLRWISIDCIADGKIVESWVEVDVLDLWQEAGFVNVAANEWPPMREATFLSQEDRAKILGTDARRLFGVAAGVVGP